jgi:hypothetical protein
VRNEAFNCSVGCRKARGLERSVEGALAEGCRSIGGGCAEAAERVCEDMEVSGEKDGGAILEKVCLCNSFVSKTEPNWLEVCRRCKAGKKF